jgi:lactoylglutathione lyase
VCKTCRAFFHGSLREYRICSLPALPAAGRLPFARLDPMLRRIPTERGKHMRYLHTMVRVADVDASLDFDCNKLGLKEVRRYENEQGRFTLIFLAASEDEQSGINEKAPLIELTYNWDPEDYKGGRNFGHLAYEVDDIYATCQHLMDNGVVINRPPRDGNMAFIRSPDGISIELLQKGPAKAKAEPWASMANTGSW